MYEEELKTQRGTYHSGGHMLTFWRSFVLDLIFSEEMVKHLAMGKQMDDSTFALSVRSM